MPGDSQTSLSWHGPKPEGSQSTFGRLAHLTRLRNPDTGEYGSAEAVPDRCTSQRLRAEHEAAFARWLAYSMQEKRADLENYLAELGHDRLATLSTWRRLQGYRVYMPASADPAEEALYLCDLETLIELLYSELPPEWTALPHEVHDWRIRQVLFRVHAGFGNVGLALKEIASGMRISSHRLGALFKQATGVGFRDYIRRLRMSRALAMLEDPKSQVAEVAAALGYSSPTNFVNDFHQYFGITPTRFRSAQGPDAASHL